MASRRSRLQIKPNIGGPKGPVVIKHVAKPKQDEQQMTSVSEKGKSEVTKPDSTKSPEQKQVTEKDNSDSSQASVGRARLRKFGQVSIPAARTKLPSKSVVDDGKDKSCEAEKSITDSPKNSNVPSSTETRVNINNKDVDNPTKSQSNSTTSSCESEQQPSDTTEKDLGSGAVSNKITSVKDVTAQPKPTTRARLPKAKPNVIEASKRRSRQQETATKTSAESPVPKGATPEPDELKSPTKSAAPEPQGSPFVPPCARTLLKTPPVVLQRSPLKVTPAVPPSPVKQTGEKRVRTLSVNEPPAVKKKKRPLVVTAPIDKPPDKTTMRMKDLIYWNPSNNPMKLKTKVADDKAAEKETEKVTKIADVNMNVNEGEEEDEALPVPQVTIGPDGNIVINEQSLVVKNKETEENEKGFRDIIDESEMFTTYGSFRKQYKSKRWSKKETAKFYRALSLVGIDFFLINQIFPKRERFELKKKFKKEEKMNGPLVEKVLKEGMHFDTSVFEQEESEEEDEQEKKKRKRAERKKKTDEEKKETKTRKTKAKSASGQAAKKKKPKKSYYEMLSEEDEECEEAEDNVSKKKSSEDTVWEPPIGDSRDGEVVSILMNLRKGNHLQSPSGTKSATQTSSPTTTSVSTTNLSSPISNSGKHSVATMTNVRQAPTVPRVATATVPNPAALSNVTHQQIQIPGGGGASVNVTGVRQTDQSGTTTNLQSLVPMTYQQMDNQSTGTSVFVTGENNDQYVLVTVMPEDGGDAVVHLYRLGRGSAGNSILDPSSAHNQLQITNNTLNQSPRTVASLQVPGTTPNQIPIQNATPAHLPVQLQSIAPTQSPSTAGTQSPSIALARSPSTAATQSPSIALARSPSTAATQSTSIALARSPNTVPTPSPKTVPTPSPSAMRNQLSSTSDQLNSSTIAPLPGTSSNRIQSKVHTQLPVTTPTQLQSTTSIELPNTMPSQLLKSTNQVSSGSPVQSQSTSNQEQSTTPIQSPRTPTNTSEGSPNPLPSEQPKQPLQEITIDNL